MKKIVKSNVMGDLVGQKERSGGGIVLEWKSIDGLQYNQAKERSESGNMDKGNGKEQQGTHNKSWLKPLFRKVEIYRRHRGRGEKGKLWEVYIVNSTEGRRGPSSFFEEGGTWHEIAPKVSDMKAANTPTREEGSANRGLQYNQAKERSESGNMDKGNGKEQQGDTQQELAQTLVSLLRSIGGTSGGVSRVVARSGSMAAPTVRPMVGRRCGRGSHLFYYSQWEAPILQMLSFGLQYNQAKERSESGNMDKGNGHMYEIAKSIGHESCQYPKPVEGRECNRGRGRGSMDCSIIRPRRDLSQETWIRATVEEQEGDTQQELAQTLVSFFEIYRRHQ
ncbi:hypothetical protein HPP92_023886 [Vanilla planifolia]|uniref:Uncharacterized protein n=1 Tax=Vanilla planifolia TaxID=51239 RepID=A0A835PJW4_VANPL|nr:hypothetical protein HPP92_023886 [Vanilla planifolia]